MGERDVRKMTKLMIKEMMRLNPKTKMVFGTSAKHEGYLVLFSALDFRNLILPDGWKIDAEHGLINKYFTNGPCASYPVFIKNTLVAGPNINICEKTDKAVIYRP